MSSSAYGPLYPSSAYWLSIVGGIIIVVFGLIEVAAGIAFRGAYEQLARGSSNLVVGLGALGTLMGVGIVILGLRLKSSPSTARTSGLLIIVFSLVSFFGGGGLYLGLILAFIGGLLALWWRPPALVQSMYGTSGYNVPIRQEPGPMPWQTPATPPPSPGVPQRFCPSCSTPNPVTAQTCSKCGAPMT